MKITAYHVPWFSQNILSGGSIEVVFSTSIRPYNCCFVMMKEFNDIIGEYPMKDGLFAVPIDTSKCLKVEPRVYVNRKKEFRKIDECHLKLGHPHPNRMAELARHCDSVPHLNSSAFKEYKCVPCLVSKTHCAPICCFSRKTKRPVELIYIDISGKVENFERVWVYSCFVGRLHR